MGDSIIYFWALPKTNLGVPGNTTAQMLARFPGEVLDRHFKAVVILGGTNDIRDSSHPLQPQVDAALKNIETMAADAEKQGLLVILCAIPPIRSEDSRVAVLNTRIRALAADHGYTLVDFYSPMAGHPEYFRDGLHPDIEGYFVMQQALAKVVPLHY